MRAMQLEPKSAWLIVWITAAVPVLAQPALGLGITVRADEVVHVMRGGIGASWHAIEAEIPSNVKHPVFAGPAHGGSAWAAIRRRRHRKVAANRAPRRLAGTGLHPRGGRAAHVAAERDRFTWDGPEMRTLYRILDWCERRKADVFFQVMWGNVDWNAWPSFEATL